MSVRSTAGWLCAGTAALTAGAAGWGEHETRSGGRMALADTLGRAHLGLYLAAVILALVAGILLGSTHTRTLSTIGLGSVVALSGLFFLLVFVASDIAPFPPKVERSAAPGGADRTMVVVFHFGTGEAETQTWEVQVEDGSGWSGRRWTVFTAAGKWPGEGLFKSASWTGPDRITVTTDIDSRIFDLSGDRPVLVSTDPA
ncbi:hypothetical protein ACIQF6_04740 [Kitasatospora sp. NPDC092948]|uniref:hypothetical protein n=1 Tax=Kitasatospora sp. NPDC092948 TaxID=3364088 RepID=UPI0038231B1E